MHHSGGVVDNGGGCACAEQGGIQEISVPSLNVVINLKML